MPNKKRTIRVIIFGWIIILWGILILLIPLSSLLSSYSKFKNNILPFAEIFSAIEGFFPFLKFLIFFAILIVIFMGLIFIICGIGLLKLKYWARYIIIALTITSLLNPLNRALLYGIQSLNIIGLLLHIIVALFILWFFMKRKTKRQFEDIKFRLKSKCGTAIIIIVLISLLIPGFILSFKVYACMTFKVPFYSKPQVIKLEKIDDASFLKKYTRVELCDISFLIHRDFIYVVIMGAHRLFENIYEMDITIFRPDKKGLFAIRNHTDWRLNKKLKKFFKSSYDYEKAYFTSNWNPVFITYRMMFFRDLYDEIKLVDSPEFKGIAKISYEGERVYMYDISLYSKVTDDSWSISLVNYKDKDFLSENDILNIISSIILLKEKKSAERYYKEGLKLYNSNNFYRAQFKFINAYCKPPENPRYGYMLSKTIIKNESVYSLGGARRILEKVLRLKPDYKDADRLLKTIKLKLEAPQYKKKKE